MPRAKSEVEYLRNRKSIGCGLMLWRLELKAMNPPVRTALCGLLLFSSYVVSFAQSGPFHRQPETVRMIIPKFTEMKITFDRPASLRVPETVSNAAKSSP